MKQGYKESTDHLRAGWMESATNGGIIIVHLKRSGQLGMSQHETDDYGTARRWIDEFVATGKYPEYQ